MAEITVEKNRWLLQDLAKPLANRPIAEITPDELLDLLKRVEKSGRRETAPRLRALGVRSFDWPSSPSPRHHRSDLRIEGSPPAAQREASLRDH